MILSDLIGTPDPEVSLTGGERTLQTVARMAAVPGAAMAAMGTLVPLMAEDLTLHGGLGGAGLVVGGALWVSGQGLVARWISDRNPQTLLLAILCGVLSVAAASLGMLMVAGFAGDFPSAFGAVAVVVAVVESALVLKIDPAWSTRGRRAGAVEPLQEMEEATLLRWLGLAAVGLGVCAGVMVAGQFVFYVINWEEDWNLLGAFSSVGVFALVGVWCAPQLLLVEWAGGRLRPTAAAVVLGAAGWAGLAGAAWWFELPLVVPLAVGVLVVLEVVLASMVLWRRLS